MGVGTYRGKGSGGPGGFSSTTARLIRKRGKSPARARRIVARGRRRAKGK